MMLPRRQLGRATLLAAAMTGLATVTHAEGSSAPNVVVYCDKALRRTMEDTGRLFTARRGAPVNVFCAAPPLMLAQIERVTQNDILITQAGVMDLAARQGLIRAATRIPLGRDRLVLAARSGKSPGDGANADPVAVLRGIGAGPLATPDPTAATTIDSAAVLARLGLPAPPPFRLIGAVDTEEVGFLLRTGAAPLGLLHGTEAQPGSGLSVAAALAGEPVTYAAAITVITRSRNAQAFIDFLNTPEAQTRLRSAGLEKLA